MDSDEFRKASRRTWGSMAAGWAAGYETTEMQNATVNDWLLTRADPRPGDAVLDIAAGPGGLSHAASRLVAPNGRVICTDFAPEMVEAARSLGAAHDIDNIEYRTLDAEQMELDDASIDVALCRLGYMTMADPGAALGETHRVLRPAGALAFSVVTGDGAFFTVPVNIFIEHGHLEEFDPRNAKIFSMADPDRVRDLTTGAGFGVIEMETIQFERRFDENGVWDDIVDRNARLSAVIGAMDPEEREMMRAAVLDGFAPYRGADGDFHLPAENLAVLARKPS